MYDMELDKALRQLLMHFRLPGEAQKIDHIIQVRKWEWDSRILKKNTKNSTTFGLD
jgi:hypothetical protein